MPTVGYARVSSTGQDLAVQLERVEDAGSDKVFKEKRSGIDAWPARVKALPGIPERRRHALGDEEQGGFPFHSKLWPSK